jgi:DNA-binding response OmpR family regulator
VYRLLRPRDTLAAVPVLFVTATERMRAQGLEGHLRWLGKPFTLDALFAAVAARLDVDPWT